MGPASVINMITGSAAQSAEAVGGRGGSAAAKGIAAAGGTGSAAVQGLILAAGASSAVPVAGWIVAGGLAVAAGTIAFVKAMRSGRMGRKEAVAKAAALGLPDASTVPAFTARLMNASSAQRVKLAGTVEKQLARKKKGGIKGPGTWFRKEHRLQAKLALIGAVEAYDMAQKRGAVPVAVPPPPQAYSDNLLWLTIAAGGGLLLLAAAYRLRR